MSPSGRCSTTSACSSTPWTSIRPRRRSSASRSTTRRRAEHARALRLGPGPGQARVRRAQAVVLAHLSELLIAGAGMAGLVAAARARELGAAPVVFEKGDRAGGSMLLSSGVIWRHRSLDDFRAECPDGDPALQARLVEELDDALDWLERLGIEPVRRETGNPLTVGRRYDTRALTEVLVRAAGDVRLREPFHEAQVLATGGFGVRLARERGLLLRAAPWSEGNGLAHGLGRGAAQTAGMDEFYGRALPGPVGEDEYVRASQLYARHALVLDDDGRDLGEAAWHESDIVQRFPGGRAWYVLDARALRQPVRERTVADLVDAARAVGGEVRPAEELPFAAAGLAEARRAAVPGGARLRRGDAHDRRSPRRRSGAGARRRAARRCPISMRRAPTRAGSSPAATAAASPRPSSTAASPPRRRCARRAACRRRAGGRRGAARGRSC